MRLYSAFQRVIHTVFKDLFPDVKATRKGNPLKTFLLQRAKHEDITDLLSEIESDNNNNNTIG